MLVVIGLYGPFEVSGVREENVHGVADDTADVEAAAEFAETFAKRKREARGLIVLEIVESGVGAREANEFVEEEVKVRRKTLKEFDFGFVHAEAEFVLALGRGGASDWRTNSRSLGRNRPSG